MRLLSLFLSIAFLGDGALHPGDKMPALSGTTLSDVQLELPTAALGKPQVIIFGFSRASGDDTRAWQQQLAKDFGENPPFAQFSVIVLESVPRLWRGMVVSGIKKMPANQWSKNIVIYKDEKLWRSRLAVSSDSHSYVVVLDGTGAIAWMNRGPFAENEYSELTTALLRLRNVR